LNKQGEILTQAEYDSKQTDVAIGRENRRKIDDAITDMYVICSVIPIYESFFDFSIGLGIWLENIGPMRVNIQIL
jgi:hypothetical protein